MSVENFIGKICQFVGDKGEQLLSRSDSGARDFRLKFPLMASGSWLLRPLQPLLELASPELLINRDDKPVRLQVPLNNLERTTFLNQSALAVNLWTGLSGASRNITDVLSRIGVVAENGIGLLPFFEIIDREPRRELIGRGINYWLHTAMPADFFRLPAVLEELSHAFNGNQMTQYFAEQLPHDVMLRVQQRSTKQLPEFYLQKHEGEQENLDLAANRSDLYKQVRSYLDKAYGNKFNYLTEAERIILAITMTDAAYGEMGTFTDGTRTLTAQAETNILRVFFTRQDATGAYLTDRTLLDLLAPTVLADLVNNICETQPDAARRMNLADIIPAGKFITLFYTQMLSVNTMAYLINSRLMDYRRDSAIMLLVSSRNKALTDQQRTDLIAKIDNKALAEMTNTLVPAVTKQNSLDPDIYFNSVPIAELWLEFLADATGKDQDKIVDILTRAESRAPVNYGLGSLSREFFTYLRQKERFDLINRTEARAWSNYNQQAQPETYIPAFAVWSSIILSGDPNIKGQLAVDIRQPGRQQIVPVDSQGQDKLRMCLDRLGEIGTFYLTHQLGILDNAKGSSDLPKIFEEIVALINQPNSDVRSTAFFKGLAAYFESKNPQGMNHEQFARLISATVDNNPIAVGILLKNIPENDFRTLAEHLDESTLQKCMYSLLAYHIVYVKRPLFGGLVTIETYEQRLAQQLSAWSGQGQGHDFSAILASVLKIPKNDLITMLSKIVGPHKTYLDFAEFLVRDFWSRFCKPNGGIVLSQSEINVSDNIYVAGPEDRIEISRILKGDLLKKYRIRITGLGTKNGAREVPVVGFKLDSDSIRCQVEITRRDGAALTKADAGSLLVSRWGDFWSAVSFGAIQIKEPAFQQKFDEILHNNGRTELAINPAILFHPQLLEEFKSTAIFMYYLVQTRGKLWIQDGKEPAVYKLGKNNTATATGKYLNHYMVKLPLGYSVDVRLDPTGDAQSYFIEERTVDNEKRIMVLITIPGSSNPSDVYALDVQELFEKSLKAQEQLFVTDREKILMALVPIAIAEWRFRIITPIAKDILEKLIAAAGMLIRGMFTTGQLEPLDAKTLYTYRPLQSAGSTRIRSSTPAYV